jgi:hypothetical protein
MISPSKDDKIIADFTNDFHYTVELFFVTSSLELLY